MDPKTSKALIGLLFYSPSDEHARQIGKVVANVVLNDTIPLCDEFGLTVTTIPRDRSDLETSISQVCFLRAYDCISSSHLKKLLRRCFEVVDIDISSELVTNKLLEEADTSEIEAKIDELVSSNPKLVEQYKGGKTNLSGFFVGQVMKAFKGKADPAVIKTLVITKLDNQ